METQYIIEFVRLADHLSFSATARELHISQSSLTRHMQMLEKEMGENLFVRTTRKIQLSDYGKAFLPWAKQMTETFQKADKAMHAYTENRNGIVHIGITHNPDLYYITDCILAFQKKYPEIPVYPVEDNLKNLLEDFENGKYPMITMAYTNWHKPETNFILAGHSRLSAIIPADNPLTRNEVVSFDQLKHVSLMVPGENTILYHALKHAFSSLEINPKIVYKGTLSGSLSLLKSGIGIIIEDEEAASRIQEPGVVVRPLAPEIGYDYGLIYANHLSQNERLYVEHVKNFFKNGSRNQECISENR